MTEILSVKPPEDVRKKIMWLAKDYPYLIQPILSIYRQVVKKGYNYPALREAFGEEAVTAYSNAFSVHGRSFEELTAATKN